MVNKRCVLYLKKLAYREKVFAETSQAKMPGENCCLNCGAPLAQVLGRKRKKFCSDKCRMIWWSKNPKAGAGQHCQYCKKWFSAAPGRERKYCSHACYIKGRFGEKKK